MLITSTHHFFSLVPQHLFSLPTHNSSSSIYTSTLFQSESPRIPSGSTSGSAADWVQGETAERRDLTGVELARDRTTPVWSEPALLLLSSLLSFFFNFYQASCSVSVCVCVWIFSHCITLGFFSFFSPVAAHSCSHPHVFLHFSFDTSKCAAQLSFTRAYFCKHTHTQLCICTHTHSYISHSILLFQVTSWLHNGG